MGHSGPMLRYRDARAYRQPEARVSHQAHPVDLPIHRFADRDFIDLGIICCESGHATVLDDIDGAIKSLEIDMGLRAATKPTGSYIDWKANRRRRNRKKRRV